MNDTPYDVIVIGLGTVGSGALYQAAKRGARVLGIDRYDPPHTMGSSYGDTRITRQAIGEGEMYLPFVRRSNEIWRELEAATHQTLFIESGCLIIAPQDGGARFHAHDNFVKLTASIAQANDITHHVLDAEATMTRFPTLQLQSDEIAYYEPGGGVLRPEQCVQAQLDQAQQHGATIHTHEIVTDYHATSEGVTVTTDKGSYHAERIILATGAWIAEMLAPDVRPPLKIYRQVVCWYEVEDVSAYYEENFPCMIWIGDTLETFVSPFPIVRDGIQAVKVLTEQYAVATTAEALDRTVHPEEVAALYDLCKDRVPGLKDTVIKADVCMYTTTPDQHFIVDFHPESEQVVIASPCSGHGFKHAAAIGESIAELALSGQTTLNINQFSLKRFLTEEK